MGRENKKLQMYSMQKTMIILVESDQNWRVRAAEVEDGSVVCAGGGDVSGVGAEPDSRSLVTKQNTGVYNEEIDERENLV